VRRIIFVDAHGWVALKHKGDHFFSNAQKLNETLLLEKSAFVTTNFVLDETYTVLRSRAGHHVAVEFGE
jgi:predicted nucleic acid-binding protein